MNRRPARRRIDTTDARVVSEVACPICAAPAGEWCTSSRGARATHPHQYRVVVSGRTPRPALVALPGQLTIEVLV